MRFSTSLVALAGAASATDILLPLYIYPSAVWNDNASLWAPAFSAIEAHPDLDWTVVINPGSGPGADPSPGNGDINVIYGVSRFNGYSNVNTIGYVHLLNGKAPMSDVKANITTYAGWADYNASDTSVNGIFFDEAIEASGVSDGSNYDYIKELATFARASLGDDIMTVCNFGAKPDSRYYEICDVSIVFESCLSSSSNAACAGAPDYKNLTTINTNVPDSANLAKSAVVIHWFEGTAYDGSAANEATLESYIHTMKTSGLGYGYFTTEDYSTANAISIPPADVGTVAKYFAAE